MAHAFPEESNECNANAGNNLSPNTSSAEFECMDLSSKELAAVSLDVFSLQFLTKLNLSNNLLTSIPEDISGLPNLLYLDISSNKLQSLPKSLRNATRLKYLNIANNSFYEVPEVLYTGLRSLRTMDMSDNLLMEFNTAPACVVTLIQLNLRKNELVKFPEWIFFSNECCLESVDLSDNPIEEATVITLANLCSKGSFETLKEINLQNTHLYPNQMEFLSHLRNIETMHLGNVISNKYKNFLEGLKSSVFTSLTKLKHLDLDYANLAGLPSDFGALNMIETLSLRYNSLSWLPDSFPELTSLKTCHLSHNTISFLPTKMGDLKNLKELHLNSNQLCDLPKSFMELVNLEILDLYDNMIDIIDCDILNKLVSLKGLDLEQNCIDKDFFEASEVKNKYEILKVDFRKLTNKESRLQGQKESCNNDTTTDDIDSYKSYSSCEKEDVDYQQEIITENWDEPEDEDNKNDDDFFDPNNLHDYSKQLVYKRRKEKELFKFNFCPGDLHAVPLIGTVAKNNKTVATSEDGQFDSD